MLKISNERYIVKVKYKKGITLTEVNNQISFLHKKAELKFAGIKLAKGRKNREIILKKYHYNMKILYTFHVKVIIQ